MGFTIYVFPASLSRLSFGSLSFNLMMLEGSKTCVIVTCQALLSLFLCRGSWWSSEHLGGCISQENR